MIEDEDLLMAVLNSAPVIDGTPKDELEDSTGDELVARFAGTGTSAERRNLQRTRAALQGIARGDSDAVERLTEVMDRIALLPVPTCEGIRWELDCPRDGRLAARSVLAWSRAAKELPGRLRACANTECNLFLLDHSRPGTAKWCSMATCGNRMKARAYARRSRES